MNYFTSDPHYHHTNIIKYCDRPFSSTEEHDEELIKRWNSVVKKCDMTYILGDLIFTKDPQQAVDIIKQLNGTIVLIRGNHDHSNVLKAIAKYVEIYSLLDLQIKDSEIDGGVQRITLCHYPMISWNQSHRGAWQLFGHHHNGNEKGGVVYSKLTPNQLEVGVDAHDFYPISYERVKELITKQNLKV